MREVACDPVHEGISGGIVSRHDEPQRCKEAGGKTAHSDISHTHTPSTAGTAPRQYGRSPSAAGTRLPVRHLLHCLRWCTDSCRAPTPVGSVRQACYRVEDRPSTISFLDRFRDLFEVLEDLIKRLADTEDPTIRGMRAKVRADLVALAGDVTPILQYSKQSWGRSTPAHAPRRAPPRRAGDLEVARRMDLPRRCRRRPDRDLPWP